MAPRGHSKAIGSDSALNLVRRPCREAEAVRPRGRTDSGQIYRLHKRFRAQLSLQAAGLSPGLCSRSGGGRGSGTPCSSTGCVSLGESPPLSGRCKSICMPVRSFLAVCTPPSQVVVLFYRGGDGGSEKSPDVPGLPSPSGAAMGLVWPLHRDRALRAGSKDTQDLDGC